MTAFRIHAEPYEAPGVADQLLARTWARYEIHVGDQCVTRHLDGGALRQGPFGSLFPLVRWIVDHWWMVLHESAHGVDVERRARRDQPWFARHDLRSAGDGFAWPTVLLHRDADVLRCDWFDDPPSVGEGRPRFLSSGRALLAVNDVAAEFSRFVELVLERVGDLEREELWEVRQRWEAIRSTPLTSPEAKLLNRAGALGLDAWDDEEVDDQLYASLAQLEHWPNALRRDFLDGVDPTRTVGASEVLANLIDRIKRVKLDGNRDRLIRRSLPRANLAKPAHDYGYAVARAARKKVLGTRLPTPNRLDEVASERFPTILKQDKLDDFGFRGLVSAGVLAVEPASKREGVARRFAAARGLFTYWTSVAEDESPRLLSNAETHYQAAGRAFAAEWLAPADVLRPLVGKSLSSVKLRQLAKGLHVDPRVIEHQVENHQLAIVEPD